jgi:uncharacterized protein YciI
LPANAKEKIAELLKPMLKKKLFVAFNKAIARPEDMLPFVAEHLTYMNYLENEGKLFASGPFISKGRPGRRRADNPANQHGRRRARAHAGRAADPARFKKVRSTAMGTPRRPYGDPGQIGAGAHFREEQDQVAVLNQLMEATRAAGAIGTPGSYVATNCRSSPERCRDGA